MNDTYGLWVQKNGSLSDKSAQKEYGISHNEIIDAINMGELQFRESNVHGNIWLRLLRVEVENFVERKYGTGYLKEKKAKKELSEIDKELKILNARVSELESRKKELLKGIVK